MYKSLRLLLLFLLTFVLATACNDQKSGSDNYLETKIQNPEVGDVYEVEFIPAGTEQKQYYLYQVYEVRPDAVSLHPARQPVASPDADISAPGFFSDKTLVYTRAEALELLREQPGDMQHSRLIHIRAAK